MSAAEFNQIYGQHLNKVYRLCLGYTGNKQTAEDLAQDVFIKIHQNLHKFRGESGIGTWIFRIAVNVCLSFLKKDQPTESAEQLASVPEESDHSNEENLALLKTFISQLPETDRILITLELEDIPQKEIADILGLSESNVRVKLHRIRKVLTDKFNRHD